MIQATQAALLHKPLHTISSSKLLLISRSILFHPHKQPFSFTYIPSAIPNDQHENTIFIHPYSHHQSPTTSNNTPNPHDDPTLVSSTEHHSHAHGNLLDKLKAIHMHALAMEQWNASRLKQSHRYITRTLPLIQTFSC